MALYFKPDHFKGRYGYTNEMTMKMCNIFTDTFLRVARECIPTKMVTVRNNDRRGLIVNSEEKLENETVFVIQQKNIANSQISTKIRNRKLN